MKPSSSEFFEVAGTRLHVRRWSGQGAPIIALHGWMDMSASFQFLAEALEGARELVAPDARGFGLSEWPVSARRGLWHYGFDDYLADLDALLERLSPTQAVDLVGHSMGANVALHYAGIRPERVRRVVSIEGFGLPQEEALRAPARARAWLDALRTPPELHAYASLDAVAARLSKNNPRLDVERARFLATHWSRRDSDGRYRLLADPAHKLPRARPYRLDETLAIWSQVRAPALQIEASDQATLKRVAGLESIASFRRRFEIFPDWRLLLIDDTGHMVHHDQPEQLAAALLTFCA